ncbi:hypothetical protein BgiBS90_027486 [Biomphalaria glabrata]|nr:hypothetical protein BgiBS90_027486 [Biomphalaria glabrata]
MSKGSYFSQSRRKKKTFSATTWITLPKGYQRDHSQCKHKQGEKRKGRSCEYIFLVVCESNSSSDNQEIMSDTDCGSGNSEPSGKVKIETETVKDVGGPKDHDCYQF